MLFLKKFISQEPKLEQFFALNLSEEKVQAAVWTVRDGKTEIVKLGQSETWDGKNQEELLKAADQTLTAASAGIKPEPSGVIFGLPDGWVEKDAVSSEKKPLMKYLCDELELKPIGFVVTDTAIIAYLKIDEGTPISAILIQLSSSEINLILVKQGKIVGSQLVGRSGDLGADAEEGLSRFDKIDTLPARIVLYNGGGDFEEDKQQLLSFDWEEKLPFIHFPKVESLDSAITIRAVALAGGSEAAQSLGMEIKTPAAKTEATAAALGFVSGKDAAEEEITPAVPEEKPEPKPKLKFNWQPFAASLKKIKIPLPNFGARWPVLLGGGLVALLIILGLAYWYVPKARVVFYLEAQVINQELEITLDPDATSVVAGGSVLPVQLVTKAVSGSQSAPATGTKIIGDPAQGGVTIYNKTADSKTFAAGTVLLGGDNLAFSLDEETTVASRSATEDSEGVITITPGKADAKITAGNIGPDSNLAAETRLSFKQFSEDDYYAKTSGLAGGTAREVKAVSQEDLDNLAAALTADLIDQAKAELGQSLGADQKVIETKDKLSLVDKNFSTAEGEAADELSLTGRLDYEGIVYRQTELDLLLKEAVKTKIPENFLISEFSGVEPGEVKEMILPISYEAKLLPRLDLAEIKKNLRGRYPEKVEEYLNSLPQFVSADIVISPKLPKVLKTLPRLTKNINLEIKPAP
ncbi:hypothetical protein COX09_03040 [Candidatus Beckwithbacteria bacterium CG23_combo_of_CG06-09_8_20_14_all_47_9]|uniref:Baseplate protein J-like domain-containing protein n=1 Tax=Candidatus Beckwithbacteria bacterium CG23_combo_of_CG06-09_8_20_14_all_47_9 TaxID=1974498 RepID=A0A2H0B3D2_9BACT|nr:MAG: hypothetical protein COX09_03040 [Candidatus Beckwithbacteria bacterium CG23_combo_of_CG06-09_8_20_14_all_47_9]